ncbi:MAG TPA: carboxypeptidase-like regulatory domain-containing protein [Blastocatellia bacterium]|nr:carboxypeptidase-like regulatory domain-containing protein [Blastocatellia bacterium]
MTIYLTRAVIIITFLAFVVSGQNNQQSQSEKPNTASISGKITINGDPAVGVQVVLTSQGSNDPSTRSTTDADGRYKMESLPSGYYHVEVMSPGYVAQVQGPSLQEEINLQEGKKLEGIDFALVKGGVITGRISDPDDNPLTGLVPDVRRLDEKGQPVPYSLPLITEFDTDDRGIYRIYGLPSGRYIIGFGFDKAPTTRFEQAEQSGTRHYSLTFYPGVTDQSQAKVIEITPGSEITGIDLRFGAKENTFKIAGIMVDAKTSAPSANVIFGYGKLSGGTYEFFEVTSRTDTKGRFKIEDLRPGKYFLKVMDETRPIFSDAVEVDLTNGDVEGLEVKVHAASIISGVVVSDGVPDGDLSAALQKITLYTTADDQSDRMFNFAEAEFRNDHSFEMKDVRPGKEIFNITSSQSGSASMWIEYIEIPNVGRIYSANGPNSENVGARSTAGPVEIAEGQNLSGVRIVVGMATAVIRGQVKFEGGQLPATGHVETRAVLVKTNNQSENAYASAIVDPDGKFVITGLTSGDYQLNIYVFSGVEQPSGPRTKEYVGQNIGHGIQNVSVQNGTTTQVTVTVKLTTPGKP